MAFLIKQISRTADGREIVRPTRLDQPRLTVGRAAESDIHLTDLAVNPTHATIESLDGRRISVRAAGGLNFGVDGRSTDAVDIDAAKGADLRFGSHRLMVRQEGGDVGIAVERVEALSDASQDKDEQRVFSLRGAMPGKRASSWAFALLILVAFLAFPIWSYATYKPARIDDQVVRPAGFHADSTWTSGSLSSAHASLEKDCQACHVDAFVAVRDESCVACHADSHEGGQGMMRQTAMTGAAAGDRANKREGPSAYLHAPAATMAASQPPRSLGDQVQGWFQNAFNVPQGRCVECHTEHEGAGPMRATAQAFCSDCHTGLQGRLQSAGIKSEIGSASDFGESHPQLRPLILAGYNQNGAIPFERRDARLGGDPMLGWSLKRVSLDRPVKQQSGLKFTHGQHLSTGRYQRNNVAQMWRQQGHEGPMECADCHTTDATGTRYLPVDMETSCQSCHSLALQTVGGFQRQLPHGQPAQVIADIRAFYSAGGAFRQAGSPVAQYNIAGRQRPGAVNSERRSDDAQRGRMAAASASGGLIRQTFGPNGVCGECHQVSFGGPVGVSIAPVAQPTRYLHKGWFDHKPHIGLGMRDANGASRVWGCRDCHAADTSNDANDLLMPTLASCQACHVGETGATKAKLVREGTKSSCAMCHDYHADFGAPWTAKTKQRRTISGQIASLGQPRR